MAIWQYKLRAIPDIPVRVADATLSADNEGDKARWHQANVPAKKIIQRIDPIIEREEIVDPEAIMWKCHKLNSDHDAHLSFDKKSGLLLSFSFRVDFRDLKIGTFFLSKMLSICDENELIVINNQGKLMKPNLTSVTDDLINSKAVAYITNPQEFLDTFIIGNNEFTKR